jgi:hypothetical protein
MRCPVSGRRNFNRKLFPYVSLGGFASLTAGTLKREL